MRFRLTQSNSEQLLDFLGDISPKLRQAGARLRNAALGLTLEISKTKSPHTMSQQGYFHLCLPIIAKQLEDVTPEDLKLYFKREAFGETYVDTPMGPILKIPSSSDKGRDEYSVLIDTMRRMCAENNFHCPDPERVY